MKDKNRNTLHWILGIPAVIFILVFAYVPLSEFVIVTLDKGNAGRPIGVSEIWFMSTRTIFLFFNLIYGTINAFFFLVALSYLLRKNSPNLIITFGIFFSFFFFVILLSGNWMIN